MDYIIRKLELEDIPQIMEIYEKITDTKSPDTDELEARMDFGESLLCLGAEIDNTLIGFIFGNIRRGEFGEEKPVGWIGLIGVDPKFQNEKIGRKLGIELIQQFIGLGINKIRTTVTNEDTELLKYFMNLGLSPANWTLLEFST